MVCAELVQTHRGEVEFAISMDAFYLILEGSFSVLRAHRSFFTAFCHFQCPVPLSQAALSPQVQDPCSGVSTLLWGCHGLGIPVLGAGMCLSQEGCPCELMRKAAEKWNQGSFRAWEVTELQKYSPELMSTSDLWASQVSPNGIHMDMSPPGLSPLGRA